MICWPYNRVDTCTSETQLDLMSVWSDQTKDTYLASRWVRHYYPVVDLPIVLRSIDPYRLMVS